MLLAQIAFTPLCLRYGPLRLRHRWGFACFQEQGLEKIADNLFDLAADIRFFLKAVLVSLIEHPEHLKN